MDERIPHDVVALLERRVTSLEEVEVLLALRRAPDQQLSAVDIARELGLRESTVRATLASLQSNDLVAPDGSDEGRWRYQPDRDAAPLVDRLAEVYAERRLEVMRFLPARAMGRVRASVVRLFRDAFVIDKNRRTKAE